MTTTRDELAIELLKGCPENDRGVYEGHYADHEHLAERLRAGDSAADILDDPVLEGLPETYRWIRDRLWEDEGDEIDGCLVSLVVDGSLPRLLMYEGDEDGPSPEAIRAWLAARGYQDKGGCLDAGAVNAAEDGATVVPVEPRPDGGAPDLADAEEVR